MLERSRDRARSIARRLNKPYYVYQPRLALKRVVERPGRGGTAVEHIEVLPWGLPILVAPGDAIGAEIIRRGVFDITVTEAILRLVAPGDVTIDAGANIGHMTGALASASGPGGNVLAFEPHPDLFAQLSRNVGIWARMENISPIAASSAALSSKAGRARLTVDDDFAWNRGLASLEPGHFDSGTRVEVHTMTLDDVIGTRPVGLVKVDVEGHEFAVLSGARRALRDRLIRDIVFEELRDAPTPSTDLLEQHGYTVMALDHSLRGPVLSLGQQRRPRLSDDDPSFLATIDPDRAVSRLGPRGWRALARSR